MERCDSSLTDQTPQQKLETTASDTNASLLACFMRDVSCLSEELVQLDLEIKAESDRVIVIATVCPL